MKRLWKFLLAALVIGTGVHAAEINSLSTTDASNTARFPESMAPSNLNNAARALEGILARWFQDWNGSLVTSGTANNYTLSLNQTLSSYYDGLKLTFEVTPSNTGPSVLNADTVGAATIAKYGTQELEEGDLVGGNKYTVIYDGGRFQLVTPVSPLASAVTSGNIPLFSGTTGKFTDSGYTPSSFSTEILSTAALPRSYLAGLGLSNNGTDADADIDIAAGEARDDGDDANLELGAALTKQLDASWAVGSNAGCLDGSESSDGTPDSNTWYHVWLIKRSDTAVVDILCSESATSPTMPSDYDFKRRIGAVRTDGTADIVAFSQQGDEFLWSTANLDASATNPGTSAVLRALTVPTGVKVWALFNVMLQGGNSGTNPIVYFSSPDQSDQAPAQTGSPLGQIQVIGGSSAGQAGGVFRIRTNTSGQVRSRLDESNAQTVLSIATLGWIDRRGRDD
jgi:hypothetical protein